MKTSCARNRNVVLVFGFVVALCVTLYLHWPPNSEAGDFFSLKRDMGSPGNSKSLEESPLQSIKQETLPRSTVKEVGPLPLDMDQEDPALAAYIRSLIAPPSKLPYNLTNPKKEHFSQYSQTQFLMQRIFPNMKGGFFLEVGAADGELHSNTLYLERQMGWRGLLIEAFPGTYQQLLQKHRKAYSIQTALSLTNKSTEVKFRVLGPKGELSSVWDKKGKTIITVRALPLYAILKALDVPVIDYLSLDIEGAEMKVLDTLPWDKVKVRVMHVEYNHLSGGHKDLVSAMEARGMRFIGTRSIDAWFVCPELYRNTIKNVTQPKE
ncbi:uncharacterized protein LOC126995893 [Eriocheir sinensis]|uniref:uncharacterized protein LOC126995893 n=1 Tax=Eriocheir sinensis TaxID=95602 RepID=UPI0021CAD7B7|nr:uncharacterized protein LOC126995893 [Eriocheir sinensis]